MGERGVAARNGVDALRHEDPLFCGVDVLFFIEHARGCLHLADTEPYFLVEFVVCGGPVERDGVADGSEEEISCLKGDAELRVGRCGKVEDGLSPCGTAIIGIEGVPVVVLRLDEGLCRKAVELEVEIVEALCPRCG